MPQSREGCDPLIMQGLGLQLIMRRRSDDQRRRPAPREDVRELDPTCYHCIDD
jgi:hypothetical protein